MATTTEVMTASAKSTTSKASSKWGSAKLSKQKKMVKSEQAPAPTNASRKASPSPAWSISTSVGYQNTVSGLSEVGASTRSDLPRDIMTNGDQQETEASPEQLESVKNKSKKGSLRSHALTQNTSATTASNKSMTASIFRTSSRKASATAENPAEERKGEEFESITEDSVVDAWSQHEVNKVVDLWKLTSTETDHLVELGEGLKDVNHWKNSPKEVVRFLKARPKSVKAAATMFRKMVQWRIDNNVDTILEDYEPPRLIRDYMPGAVLMDFDKDGDPVYCERIGSADSPEMVHRFGPEHLIKHAIWIREKISQGKWVKEYEKRTGRPVCQILVVEDQKGLSMHHLDRKLLAAFQAITRLDQDNYPEVAKKLVNINAPFIFRMAWSLVKHFFDPNVADKMVFLSSGQTEKVLSEYLDLKVLPREIVPQGEGKAAPGLPPNFKGGPLPPIGTGDDESYLSLSKRKETASESSSSAGDGDRQNLSLDSESVYSGHSSVWSGPVRTYLHKKQVKRDEKKEQEIRDVRDMAAKRLQPKELTSAQRGRLGRLRDAKLRRTGSDDASSVGGGAASVGGMSRGSEPDHKKSLSLKTTDRIQSHDRKTRFLVMTLLISLLFILLNPELFEMSFGVKLVGKTSSVWWMAILQGLGLVLYTMVCAAVHFVTCDISLVYAFNAMDLGSKAGREVKKFYSENVRLAVAGVSFGIFLISFAQALVRVIFSVLTSKTTEAVRSLAGSLTSLVSKVSPPVEYLICLGDNFQTDMGMVINENCASRTAAAHAAQEIAESAQRAAEKAKEHISDLSEHISEMSQLVWSKVEVGTVDEVVSSWQSDAFHTARMLFSYTAVFLLVFLVLFNYSASSAVSRTKAPPKSTEPKTPVSTFDGTPPASPSDVTRDSDDGEYTVHSEVSSVADSTADDSSTQRKRRKFRLFKKRAHRPVLGAVTEESTDMQIGARGE